MYSDPLSVDSYTQLKQNSVQKHNGLQEALLAVRCGAGKAKLTPYDGNSLGLHHEEGEQVQDDRSRRGTVALEAHGGHQVDEKGVALLPELGIQIDQVSAEVEQTKFNYKIKYRLDNKRLNLGYRRSNVDSALVTEHWTNLLQLKGHWSLANQLTFCGLGKGVGLCLSWDPMGGCFRNMGYGPFGPSVTGVRAWFTLPAQWNCDFKKGNKLRLS